MMTDILDGVRGAASSLRLWRGRLGLAAMLSDHPELYSSEDILDCLALANLDTRKRKEISCGGRDAAIKLDGNKRNKHEFSEYSGASSDTHSNPVDVLPGKKLMLQTNCVISSPLSRHSLEEQSTSAVALGAADVDTSLGSTDNDNAGDDEYSRGGTNTFNSSVEGSSQRLQYRDPIFRADQNISVFNQTEKQTDDLWSGDSNLLHFQLGFFIHKEKQKLESEFKEGSSGLSQRSLSDSLRGHGSTEIVTGMRDERSSGSSGSLSGFLGASSTCAESIQAGCHGGMIHSSRASSMLLSCVGNKKLNGLDFRMNKDKVSEKLDTKVRSVAEKRIFLTDSLRGVWRSPFSSSRLEKEVCKMQSLELHQKFVLSSGRLSHVIAPPEDTRASTIDRDFDDYFANLIL